MSRTVHLARGVLVRWAAALLWRIAVGFRRATHSIGWLGTGGQFMALSTSCCLTASCCRFGLMAQAIQRGIVPRSGGVVCGESAALPRS